MDDEAARDDAYVSGAVTRPPLDGGQVELDVGDRTLLAERGEVL